MATASSDIFEILKKSSTYGSAVWLDGVRDTPPWCTGPGGKYSIKKHQSNSIAWRVSEAASATIFIWLPIQAPYLVSRAGKNRLGVGGRDAVIETRGSYRNVAL